MNWLTEVEFFTSEKFKRIANIIKKQRDEGYTILPPKKDMFNAFVLTPLDEVKVVIFGQDPYPTIGHPTGLAFSVHREVEPLPKSLINIFKELKNDVGIERIDGDLSDWAKQGVLLLNTSLSVIAGSTNSHSSLGWKVLIRDVIESINKNKKYVVFILWGQHAQSLEKYIDQSKHLIIKSAHPSPLSALRGFFGSKCFSHTNKYLIDHNIIPIVW